MNIQKIVNRCTGHCCKSFTVSHEGFTWHINDVRRWLAEEKRAKNNSELTDETKRLMRMLVQVEDGGEYSRFTCKNFDTESGNCKIYTTRPEMCRNFPKEECTFTGCTFKRL